MPRHLSRWKMYIDRRVSNAQLDRYAILHVIIMGGRCLRCVFGDIGTGHRSDLAHSASLAMLA